MISLKELFLVLFIATFNLPSIFTLKEGDCEVCINVINKFSENISDADKKDPKKIEAEFRKFCKTSKNKENRFVSIG